MVRIIVLLLFLSCLQLKAQNDYEWLELKSITLYNSAINKSTTDSIIQKVADTTTHRAICNIQKWKPSLSAVPNGPRNDVAVEKTFLIICEFQDGSKIPFAFYPNQNALFDLRPEHFNYFSFPKDRNKYISEAFNTCLTCAMDPKCNEEF